jgi:hypothetical protein
MHAEIKSSQVKNHPQTYRFKNIISNCFRQFPFLYYFLSSFTISNFKKNKKTVSLQFASKELKSLQKFPLVKRFLCAKSNVSFGLEK